MLGKYLTNGSLKEPGFLEVQNLTHLIIGFPEITLKSRQEMHTEPFLGGPLSLGAHAGQPAAVESLYV